MVGGQEYWDRVSTSVQMLTLGKDKVWSHPSQHIQYSFMSTLNNEVFYGGQDNFINQWNKTSLNTTRVMDLGHSRYGYSHISSVVSLDSGIEKWCLSNIKENCANNNNSLPEF